jgi:DNA-binding transcriptional ArsR family regulator
VTPREIGEAQRELRARVLEALAEGEAPLSELELRIPLPGGRPEGRSWRAVLEVLETLERTPAVRARFDRRLRVWGLTDIGRARLARRRRRCSR